MNVGASSLGSVPDIDREVVERAIRHVARYSKQAQLSTADHTDLLDALGLTSDADEPAVGCDHPKPERAVRSVTPPPPAATAENHSPPDDNAWMREAVCRDEDPELFFPAGTTGPALQQTEEAKAVCRRCPVIADCLETALRRGHRDGVWGGMSEEERSRIRRRRPLLLDEGLQKALLEIRIGQAIFNARLVYRTETLRRDRQVQR